jgi:tetratricopeptide (TPR) repeat protein
VTAPRVFISYRRDDAAGEAGRLADHLQRRFGADRVFLDIETIEPGTDFVQVLKRSLEETAAVLVVIGRQWLGIRDAAGTRRLDDPADFVRREVEAALGRGVPVVPVLVQGAPLPLVEELPASLAPLVTRQAATLDHAEFHADIERLCERLAPLVARGRRGWWPLPVSVAVAGLVLLALVAGGYAWYRGQAQRQLAATVASARLERTRQVAALVEAATGQRQRRQFGDAVETLEAARRLDPEAADAGLLLEDVAMQCLRELQRDESIETFGEAMKPALAIVDRALPGSSGSRRADLLAHQGWAAFLLWRDGDRELRSPSLLYREALAIDADNPYANAMLAHWTLWDGDDVDEAARLFGAGLRSGRAVEAVRSLQWAAYQNDSSVRAQVEIIRLADVMRRAQEKLTPSQSQTMWGIYYFALPTSRDAMRPQVLRAVSPDDHLATLRWAFDEFTAGDASRRQTIRYYAALLDLEAGRPAKARQDLTTLRIELASSPGRLLDAVQAALARTR